MGKLYENLPDNGLQKLFDRFSPHDSLFTSTIDSLQEERTRLSDGASKAMVRANQISQSRIIISPLDRLRDMTGISMLRSPQRILSDKAEDLIQQSRSVGGDIEKIRRIQLQNRQLAIFSDLIRRKLQS